MAERAQRAATSENTCKYKKHQQIKKTFSSFWQQVVQMLTTQTNKETRCKCSQHNQIHFICSVFLFWLCCEHLQRVRCQIDESVFLICRCFFFYLQCVSFLVVLWAFAAHVSSNWGSCFLNLQVFFSISFLVVSIGSACVVKLRKLFP